MANDLKAKKDNEFVRELDRLVNASDKTQIDIAEEIGYDNHNMMTMFKRGLTRVPMERVVPLAKALGADPSRLLNLWFDVYMPGAMETVSSLSGKMMLSAQEKSWIIGLRNHFSQSAIPMFELHLLKPERVQV